MACRFRQDGLRHVRLETLKYSCGLSERQAGKRH